MKVQVGTNSDFQPERFEAEGSILLNGEAIPFQIISEDYVITDDAGDPLGTFFLYSYFRKDVTEEEAKQRPVLFAFNGGPVSSNLWLHLGLLGPRRVKMPEEINPSQLPPFELEDNPHTILDICDLVLMDPVGCGYGLILSDKASEELFSIEKDARAFAAVIEKWLILYDRWNSPKYIMGESYGTIRCGALSYEVMGGPMASGAVSTGISLNGIFMLGTSLPVNPYPNYTDEAKIEEAVLNLPTMAAISWYYEEGEKETLEERVEKAYTFASDEYLRALFLENRMSDDERESYFDNLSYFTGLSVDFLKQKNGRVSTTEFSEELRRAQDETIGLYDARYTLRSSNRIGTPDPVADEAAMGQYTAVYRGAMSTGIKEELGITLDRPFIVINFEINGLWIGDGVNTPLQKLQAFLQRNPEMKLMIGSGYYDLSTPIGAAQYTVSRLEYEDGQVQVRAYPSGHMSYIGEESAVMIENDIREVINAGI